VQHRQQFDAAYEDQIWLTGTVEDIFDLVCDIHVTNTGS
jgi:hypothetical protein